MRSALLAAAAAFALAGCQHLTPDYRAIGEKVNGTSLLELDLVDDFEERFGDETASTSADDRSSLRREMVATLLAVSDVRCENYLVGVSVSSNSTRAGLDLTSLALGTAGGVATPEESANLLSALSTLAGGARQSLADTVFAGRDFPVIYSAIRNGRRAQRDRYLDLAHDGDFDRWGFGSILNLMNAYDLDCGINYGLQLISDAVAAQGVAGRREIAAGAADDGGDDQISQPAAPRD